MMKSTAIAHPNIALIKYWGNLNDEINLPANNSISMVMSGVSTKTTVEFGSKLNNEIIINDKKATGEKARRVDDHIQRILKLDNRKTNYKIVSKNDFPTGAGLASSASGFAALTVAACDALAMKFDTRRLSIIARHGSGSACRSIHSGFVEWISSQNSEDSYAEQIAPEDHIDLADLVAIVETHEKKVSSKEGHRSAINNPYFKARLSELTKIIPLMRNAIKNKDFQTIGELAEHDCLSMHSVMMTSNPMLLYWQPETIKVINKVVDVRALGLECYFTIDAGPNVHVLCRQENADEIKEKLKSVKGVKDIIVNNAGNGTEVISDHLF